MSENIVKFGGDTTARELYEGGKSVSTGLSRILNPNSRNFSMVVFQQGKPLLDSELNLLQQSQNKLRADVVRTLLSSGIVSISTTANITDKKNTLRISDAVANLNGWLLYLYGANRSDNSSDIIFPAAPYNGTREDLAFLETWFEEVAPSGSPEDDSEVVYKNGGLQSGTVANDLEDNVAGDETTRRIQLRWQIRTVTDVNFTNYPDGVNNADRVKARAGASDDTNYSYSKVSTGLYRAGDGSTAACTALHCVDGYVYAIPLYQVHRRNQTAYNADDNKYGAPAYSSGTIIASGLYHDVIAPGDVTAIYPTATAYEHDNDAQSNKATLHEIYALVRQHELELEKWKEQRIQQGTVTISNKFVVYGGIINAVSGTRNVKITKTGTYNATAYSRIYMDGQFISFDDTEDSVAAVPVNNTSSAVNYYAYVDNTDGKYSIKVGDSVPDGKLGLYRINVPANDTAANLDDAKFTDIRRVESHYRNYYSTIPSATVTLPYAAASADYDVALNIESTASNVGTTLEVINKKAFGFTVRSLGIADNVKVHWTMTQANT